LLWLDTREFLLDGTPPRPASSTLRETNAAQSIAEPLRYLTADLMLRAYGNLVTVFD
jgi:hypothetical protein